MSQKREQIDDIFFRALQCASASQRATYLETACMGDSRLSKRIEQLVQAYPEVKEFLETPAATGITALDELFHECPGSQIGPYTLVREIGRGGMGIVYLAHQKEPVERQVAIKIIKPGLDTQQVIARFASERQVLSVLDHPHIARVLDAGTTASGRPFFVMELIDGKPINQFCDEHQLTIKQRLQLFIPVCLAVQQAHQKGIIHRDIKPSNVLVATHDGHPVPKVIDFGIAKAFSLEITNETPFTERGQFIGTPEYTSPEQASLNPLDVDTRSDIYSLGVLLYELICGSTPLERERLRTVAFEEMLRLIRHEEPPRPSKRLSVSNTLGSIAEHRQTNAVKLYKLVRGELDWIVMKTLEKDRSRRYESTSNLAADIERYLNDDPVLACPPSMGYRFQKFARRHRVVVSAVLIATSAMVVGTGLATWQAMIARDAQRQAEDAKQQLAQRYRIAKESIDTYLLRITQDEQLDHPSFRKLRQRLLEAALPYYDQLHKLSPTDDVSQSARTEALNQLGRVQHELGQFNESRSAYEEAAKFLDQLAAANPSKTVYRQSLASVLVNLADHYRTRGDSGSMLAYEQHALELRKELHAKQPADDLIQMELAQSYTNVGVLIDRNKGRKLLEDAIQLWQGLSDRFPAELRYREYLSLGYHNLGHQVAWINVEEAVPFHERAIELRSELAREQPESKKAQIQWSQSHQYLADTLAIRSSQLGEALKHRQESEQILREYAKKHPQWPEVKAHWASSKEMLARTLKEQGELDLAQESCQSALILWEQLVSEFPGVLEYDVGLSSTQHSLGALKMAQGVPAEGLPILTEALDRLQKTLDRIGPHDQGNLLLRNIHSSLADTRKSLGQDPNRLLGDETPEQVIQVAGEALPPSKFLTDLSYPSVHGLRAEREASSLSQTEDEDQTMKRQREKISRSSRDSANRGKRSLIVESLEERALMAVDISISDAIATEGSSALTFIDRFVPAGAEFVRPRHPVFGPDGNGDGIKDLYIGSADTDEVLRYDGVTGAFLGVFVSQGSGGLDGPSKSIFGPDGNLYVSGFEGNHVLRYDGSTGAFLNVVASELSGPIGLTFGSDGDLYIASHFGSQVFRYDGSNNSLSVFVLPGSGGLNHARNALFGPDANGDGKQDLYVASQETWQVLRYDGLTGSYIDVFATMDGAAASMEFAPNGDLYVGVAKNGVMDFVRFDVSTRASVDKLSVPSTGFHFTFDDNNVLYNTNGIERSILRFGPSSTAAFKVSLTSASSVPVTVSYTTVSSSAVAGSDFHAMSGVITFAPGQVTRTIFVPTIDDATAESTETFTVTLSNAVGATIADGMAIGSILDNDPFTKFYVVNDGTTTSNDQTFKYQATGQAIGSATGLGSGNSAPRGAASNAAGDKVWVVDANKKVYVYDSNGSPLGNWNAGGLASNAQVEGIATNGKDVWLVDNQSDRVYFYSGAASLTIGSQNATSSFNLNSGNKNAKDIVTDGNYLWVVNDSKASIITRAH